MDLNAPLGLTPPPPSRRPIIVSAAIGAALIVAGGVGYLLATADPRDGEPMVVAALPPHVAPKPKPTIEAPTDLTTGSLAAPVMATNALVPSAPVGHAGRYDGGSFENGVRVFRGTEATDTQPAQHGPLVIDVTRQLDAAPQKTKAIGPATGSTPIAGVATAPRIAIYVSGMGLSKIATRTAIDIMPPAVALAFVPYGETVSASVDAARAKGHEVLLQLPMQNALGGAPGPHALRPGEPAEALAGDLDWLMGRFAGYDGVTNLLGAPVTADTPLMTAVLKAVGNRKLFFVDDGTSKRSVVPGLAAQLDMPAKQVDVLLDATADPAVVQANLKTLLTIARTKGQAIGMASGLPEHLAAIARFASNLAGENVTLVSLNTLARGDANVAANAR